MKFLTDKKIDTKNLVSVLEQNLALKLQKPKLILKSEEINLSKLDIYLSIKSFFSSDFALKKALAMKKIARIASPKRKAIRVAA